MYAFLSSLVKIGQWFLVEVKNVKSLQMGGQVDAAQKVIWKVHMSL